MSMYNMTNVYITTELETFYLIIPHFVGEDIPGSVKWCKWGRRIRN